MRASFTEKAKGVSITKLEPEASNTNRGLTPRRSATSGTKSSTSAPAGRFKKVGEVVGVYVGLAIVVVQLDTKKLVIRRPAAKRALLRKGRLLCLNCLVSLQLGLFPIPFGITSLLED